MCAALERLQPDPLSRRHGIFVTQSAFGKAFVDHRQQCDRVNGLRRHRIARGASASLDGEASLTDAIVVAPGTASVLKAEHLRGRRCARDLYGSEGLPLWLTNLRSLISGHKMPTECVHLSIFLANKLRHNHPAIRIVRFKRQAPRDRLCA
jgi:hypothetical protein